MTSVCITIRRVDDFNAGEVIIDGVRMSSPSTYHEARAKIGYCPQSDTSLFDLLTIKEHLELFSSIRGVRIDDQSQYALGDLLGGMVRENVRSLARRKLKCPPRCRRLNRIESFAISAE